jgi:general stress protein 26
MIQRRKGDSMTTTPDLKLHKLLKDFGVAMLTTCTAEGQLRSRPMAVAHVEEDGTLWVMTQRNSPKLDEVALHRQVNVSMQSSTKFVSLSGTAMPVEDRQKVEELWTDSWQIWFPGGKDDPTLMLLRVTGEAGEYWDNSGTNGIKYLIEAGRAYFTGTRPQVDNDPKIHGKVKL